MEILKKYGPDILAINKFVGQLDPAIKAEAFKLLAALQFGELTAQKPIRIAGADSAPAVKKSPLLEDRELSPQELLQQVIADSIFEKAVLFGYWLEMFRGEKSFSGGKLKEVFEMAREPVPSNPSDVVAKLERSGKLMRAEKMAGTQYYRLTRTAIGEIEDQLKIQN